jgi:hypothetical protein
MRELNIPEVAVMRSEQARCHVQQRPIAHAFTAGPRLALQDRHRITKLVLSEAALHVDAELGDEIRRLFFEIERKDADPSVAGRDDDHDLFGCRFRHPFES